MKTFLELVNADVDAWLDCGPQQFRQLLDGAGEEAGVALSTLTKRVAEVRRVGTPNLLDLFRWMKQVTIVVQQAGAAALVMPTSLSLDERITAARRVASIAMGPATREALARLASELCANRASSDDRADGLFQLARAAAYDTKKGGTLSVVLRPCSSHDITSLLLKLVEHPRLWSSVRDQLLEALMTRGEVGAIAYADAITEREDPNLLQLLELAAHWASQQRLEGGRVRDWLLHVEACGETAGVLATEVGMRDRALADLFSAYIDAEPRNVGETLDALTGTRPFPASKPAHAWGMPGVQTEMYAANPYDKFREAPDFDSYRVIRAWDEDKAICHILSLDSPLESLQTLLVVRQAKHPAKDRIFAACVGDERLLRRAALAARRDPKLATRIHRIIEDFHGLPAASRKRWVQALYLHLDAAVWSHSHHLLTDLTSAERSDGLRAAAQRAERLGDWLTLRSMCELLSLSNDEFDAFLVRLDGVPFLSPSASVEISWVMDLWLTWDKSSAIAKRVLSAAGAIRLPTLPDISKPHDIQWGRLFQYFEQLGRLFVRMTDAEDRERLLKILDFQGHEETFLSLPLWYEHERGWRGPSTGDSVWSFMGRVLILESLALTRSAAVHGHLRESVGRDAGMLLLCLKQRPFAPEAELRREVPDAWIQLVERLAPELVSPVLDEVLKHARINAPAPRHSEKSRGVPWWHEAVAFVSRWRPTSTSELLNKTQELAARIDASDLEMVATVALSFDALDERGDEWDELTKEFRDKARRRNWTWEYSAVPVLVTRLYSLEE